jgi:hypothetical protein
MGPACAVKPIVARRVTQAPSANIKHLSFHDSKLVLTIRPPVPHRVPSSLMAKLPDSRPGFTPSDLASDRASLIQEAILSSLAITQASSDRESQITESYSETFSWIFEHEFGRWLSAPMSSSPVQAGSHSCNTFWINGLPGSGKSTLIRYIHERPETRQLIAAWNQDAVIASFFFWESGTIMQRSQEGLLRSLISQLLDHHPHLVREAFPDLWSMLWTASTVERVRALAEWSIDDLKAGLIHVFKIRERKPVFLLIDGLDELEGDQTEALKLIDRISQSDRVKICVSSRPWDVFTRWFVDTPFMRLQDLTKGDMERFVVGKLTAELGIQRLFEDHTERAAAYVARLLAKASGVFLWADIAVTIITEDVVEPAWTNLNIRLDQLPETLDNLYYYRVVKTSPSTSIMSQTFQLMRAREEVAAFTRDDETSIMSLWELTLASLSYTTGAVCKMDIRQIGQAAAEERCISTYQKMKTATSKLISIQAAADTAPPRQRVTYVHRTVKDWLAHPHVWEKIISLSPDVHPHLAHLRSVVLSFKLSLDKPRRGRSINAWWPRIVLALTHSRFIQSEQREETIRLLDGLNTTLTWYFPRLEKDARYDHWARSCFGNLEERGRVPFEDPFLSLVIKFGVRDYVLPYLSEGRYEEHDGRSLLTHAVAYLVHRQQSLYPLADYEIVKALLEFGLDPNFRMDRPSARTPWEVAIEAVQQAHRRGWIGDGNEATEAQNIERWASILRLFLEHGAVVTASAQATWRDQKESAVDLLHKIVAGHDHFALIALRDYFLDMLKAREIEG